MGILQYECMISAATPPQNVGCERCLLYNNEYGAYVSTLLQCIHVYISYTFHILDAMTLVYIPYHNDVTSFDWIHVEPISV